MHDYTFTIKKDGLKKRVDHYLVEVLPKNKVSRTYIKKLINGGDILLNDRIIKPHHQLNIGDIIKVHMPEAVPETGLKPENTLAGVSPDRIMACTEVMLAKETNWPNPFGDGKASERIVNIITEAGNG